MLAADAVAYADGGGIAFAATKPVHGRKKVGNLLMAGARRGRDLGVVGMRRVEINGEPGAVFVRRDGEPVGVVALEISEDQVQTIRAISNPEKLGHLRRGPIDVDLTTRWEHDQDPSLGHGPAGSDR
jgi:RNA polymerase sigma-70 factor (ECF subfamily)